MHDLQTSCSHAHAQVFVALRNSRIYCGNVIVIVVLQRAETINY